jgi:hypothetical protein
MIIQLIASALLGLGLMGTFLLARYLNKKVEKPCDVKQLDCDACGQEACPTRILIDNKGE